MLTDGTGAVAWDAVYRPFGAASVTGSVTFNLRFPGQYYDAETGLHYNYFRDYDASLGRYIQSDPIGLAGGTNTYMYVAGNPNIFTDPRGLVPSGCRWIGYRDVPGEVIGSYEAETGKRKNEVEFYQPSVPGDVCPPEYPPENCIYYVQVLAIVQPMKEVKTINVRRQYREDWYRCTLREPDACGGWSIRTRLWEKRTPIQNIHEPVEGSEKWKKDGRPYFKVTSVVVLPRGILMQ